MLLFGLVATPMSLFPLEYPLIKFGQALRNPKHGRLLEAPIRSEGFATRVLTYNLLVSIFPVYLGCYASLHQEQ